MYVDVGAPAGLTSISHTGHTGCSSVETLTAAYTALDSGLVQPCSWYPMSYARWWRSRVRSSAQQRAEPDRLRRASRRRWQHSLHPQTAPLVSPGYRDTAVQAPDTNCGALWPGCRRASTRTNAPVQTDIVRSACCEEDFIQSTIHLLSPPCAGSRSPSAPAHRQRYS